MENVYWHEIGIDMMIYMLKHDEYVYVDFILNDMDHEYNDGYENNYDIHICSWKYDDDWDIDKWYFQI